MQTSSTLADNAKGKWQGSEEALRQKQLIFLKHDYLGEEVQAILNFFYTEIQDGLESKIYINAQQFFKCLFSKRNLEPEGVSAIKSNLVNFVCRCEAWP